jgi:hypothetical protein
MTVEIVAAESTKLFIGTDDAPRQVVHVVLRGTGAGSADVARVTVEGPGLEAGEPIGVYPYTGMWFDIGRREDYERAVEAWVPTATAGSEAPLTLAGGMR